MNKKYTLTDRENRIVVAGVKRGGEDQEGEGVKVTVTEERRLGGEHTRSIRMSYHEVTP